MTATIVTRKEVREFLRQSNAIENVFGVQALNDAEMAWNILPKDYPPPIWAILKAHKNLLHRINPRIAGKFRDCAVWIGDSFCPAFPPEEINLMVQFWLKEYWFANTEGLIKEAHVAFERIHPFEDGNGRIGRMLMNIQRLHEGLPLLIIHTGDEQQAYYRWLDDERYQSMVSRKEN